MTLAVAKLSASIPFKTANHAKRAFAVIVLHHRAKVMLKDPRKFSPVLLLDVVWIIDEYAGRGSLCYYERNNGSLCVQFVLITSS